MTIRAPLISKRSNGAAAPGASFPAGIVALVDFSSQSDGAALATTHSADGVSVTFEAANSAISGGRLVASGGQFRILFGGLPVPANGRYITVQWGNSVALTSGQNVYVDICADMASPWGYASCYYARMINAGLSWKSYLYKRVSWSDSYPFGSTQTTQWSNFLAPAMCQQTLIWTPDSLNAYPLIQAVDGDGVGNGLPAGGSRADENSAAVTIIANAYKSGDIAIDRIAITDF